MPTANPIGQASFSSASYAYNALLSDGDDINTKSGTVASGIGVLVRGTIVNWDPAAGAITVPTTVAGCNAILVNDVDATSATVPAQVYTTGSFKADAIIWPGALSHSLVTDQLRDYQINIQSVVYTDGTLVKSGPTKAEEDEAKKRLEENIKAKKEAADEAEKKAKGESKEDKDAPKPADSTWAYLTADQREKEPDLAENQPPEKEEEEKKGKEPDKSEPPVHKPAEHHTPGKK